MISQTAEICAIRGSVSSRVAHFSPVLPQERLNIRIWLAQLARMVQGGLSETTRQYGNPGVPAIARPASILAIARGGVRESRAPDRKIFSTPRVVRRLFQPCPSKKTTFAIENHVVICVNRPCGSCLSWTSRRLYPTAIRSWPGSKDLTISRPCRPRPNRALQTAGPCGSRGRHALRQPASTVQIRPIGWIRHARRFERFPDHPPLPDGRIGLVGTPAAGPITG